MSLQLFKLCVMKLGKDGFVCFWWWGAVDGGGAGYEITLFPFPHEFYSEDASVQIQAFLDVTVYNPNLKKLDFSSTFYFLYACVTIR